MNSLYAKLKSPIDYNDVYEKIIERGNTIEWYSTPQTHSFEVIKVQMSYITDHPVLSVINNKFKIYPFVFRLPANTFYNWHTDADRPASINLPLNNLNKSFTSYIIGNDNKDVSNINTLKYDPGHFYLLNSQVKHSVLNLDEDRYFFSLTFELNKTQITYQDIYNYCYEMDLLA